jgi:hydrogenase maturation protease
VSRTVVIGFGNLLLSDDGVGIRIAEELRRRLPEDVEVLDGGVASLDVLDTVRDAGRWFIIDALAGGNEPGSVYRLIPADLGCGKAEQPFSLHQFSLADALAMAAARAALPPTVIYGVEPQNIELGLELSPAVAAALPRVVELIMREVQEQEHA